MIARVGDWLLQLLIALDQLLNALFMGWADETVSSRAWRLSSSSRGWAAVRSVIDVVFGALGQQQHCFEAWTSERLRLQFPVELRDGQSTT